MENKDLNKPEITELFDDWILGFEHLITAMRHYFFAFGLDKERIEKDIPTEDSVADLIRFDFTIKIDTLSKAIEINLLNNPIEHNEKLYSILNLKIDEFEKMAALEEYDDFKAKHIYYPFSAFRKGSFVKQMVLSEALIGTFHGETDEEEDDDAGYWVGTFEKLFSVTMDLYKQEKNKIISLFSQKKLNTLSMSVPSEKTAPVLGQFSNSQRVLIFYYFFKYCRLDIDKTQIARFIHLISGIDYTKAANSDIYKKLQNAPNFKSDKSLIDDLEAIKLLFQRVELNEIVKMIDNELDIARQHTRKTRL